MQTSVWGLIIVEWPAPLQRCQNGVWGDSLGSRSKSSLELIDLKLLHSTWTLPKAKGAFCIWYLLLYFSVCLEYRWGRGLLLMGEHHENALDVHCSNKIWLTGHSSTHRATSGENQIVSLFKIAILQLSHYFFTSKLQPSLSQAPPTLLPLSSCPHQKLLPFASFTPTWKWRNSLSCASSPESLPLDHSGFFNIPDPEDLKISLMSL